MALTFVPNSILLLVLRGASGFKPSSTDVSMEPLTEGDLEALPVNELAGSDIETSVKMVSWFFVTAARMFAALSSVSFAFVVAAFLPCGPASSPEPWRHPG